MSSTPEMYRYNYLAQGQVIERWRETGNGVSAAKNSEEPLFLLINESFLEIVIAMHIRKGIFEEI